MNYLFSLLWLVCARTIAADTGPISVHGNFDVVVNATKLVLPNVFLVNELCFNFAKQINIYCVTTGMLNAVVAEVSGDACISPTVSVLHTNRRMTTEHPFHCNIADQQSYTGNPLDSFMVVDSPSYGALVTEKLEIAIGSVGTERFASIHFVAPGVADTFLDPDTTIVESTNLDVQPSSVFYKLHTVAESSAGGVVRQGYGVESYLEFVLSEEAIRQSRKYKPRDIIFTASDGTSWSSAATDSKEIPPGPDNTIEVCIFAGPKMDGQKQIWSQQSRHLSHRGFHFTWLVHLQPNATLEDQAASNPVVQHLLTLRPTITVAPNPAIQLDLSMLSEDPGDGRGPAALIWRGAVADLYMYAHDSLIAAEYVIDRVQPSWCRVLFEQARRTLLEHRCDIAVYGNQGGFGSDVGLIHTARALGIPTVAEMMNLHLHPRMVPAAVVAPSTFVLEHTDIAAVLEQDLSTETAAATGKQVKGVVIPPSIDSALFDPARFRLPEGKHREDPGSVGVYVYPGCRGGSLPCIVVGFIARLSPEKGPGMFLQMAHHLLRSFPFARFTIVGDGVLRASLEGLAARLGISWAVHFTGWVGAEQLPAVLAGMDIVVNPGLVLETFCIANVEAMSMELPLVTFAVGGVGEYVAQPAERSGEGEEALSEGERRGDYSVSANAVVVHRASPAALAGAVEHLILHPPLRRALGKEARRTVLSSFSVERQMTLYTDLYLELFRSSDHKK